MSSVEVQNSFCGAWANKERLADKGKSRIVLLHRVQLFLGFSPGVEEELEELSIVWWLEAKRVQLAAIFPRE